MIDRSDIARLDVHSLNVFLAVYDMQSMSQAAEQFGLTQSTISHCVDRLRSAFNDQLFVRSGRGIMPTERAEQLIPKVKQLIADFESLADQRQYDPSNDSLPVTLATNVTELLPELKTLRDKIWSKAPSLPLRFLELGSRENIEATLDSGKADLVVSVRSPAYPPTLNVTHLFDDHLVVFFDPTAREPVRSVEDYANARHAVLDFGGGQKSNVELALEEAGVSRSVVLAVSNARSMAGLIQGTDIIATMQSRLAYSALNDLGSCPPPVPMPAISFDLVWHRRVDNSGRNTWLRRQVIASRDLMSRYLRIHRAGTSGA